MNTASSPSPSSLKMTDQSWNSGQGNGKRRPRSGRRPCSNAKCSLRPRVRLLLKLDVARKLRLSVARKLKLHVARRLIRSGCELQKVGSKTQTAAAEWRSALELRRNARRTGRNENRSGRRSNGRAQSREN